MAGVVVGLVTVVAELVALHSLGEVLTHHTISAPSDCAQSGARVGVELVAVVAGFIAVFARLEIPAHHTITATRQSAIAQAGVCVLDVAVVARLALVQASVAAAERDAVARALIIV